MAARFAKRGRPRRISFLDFEAHIPEYQRAEFHEHIQSMRVAGQKLLVHLQTLYALGKISAQDFCVACHWADEAQCLGGDFFQFSQAPGLQSGRYQQFLDQTFMGSNLYTNITVPITQPKRSIDDTMELQVSLAFESIAEELRQHPELFQESLARDWPPCFTEHEVTRRCTAQQRERLIPLAVYTDGVRYQSPTSSNCDSMTGVWLINAVSGKRHLVSTWRSGRSCRCGCKGWHSNWCILEYLKFCLVAMAEGRRPETDMNGNAWGDGHVMTNMLNLFGQNLGFFGAVCWLKGDLSDVNKTHGLPSVSSTNNPCMFCKCAKEDMHAYYSDMLDDEWPWDLIEDGEYEAHCTACEHEVHVANNAALRTISQNVQFLKGQKQYGPTLVNDVVVGGKALKKGDYLTSSKDNQNPQDFHNATTPTIFTFWRESKDGNGVRKGHAVHRNPIFCRGTGLQPHRTCAVDLMHTLCSGLFQRIVSCILWRIILANPWRSAGNKTTRIEASVKQLRNFMFDWQDEQHIPFNDRLGDLTVSTLGGEPSTKAFDDDGVFVGQTIRLKAHETLVMLRFAVYIARKFPQFQFRRHACEAAEAMLSFYDTLKGAPVVVPPATIWSLRVLMTKGLVRCGWARVRDVPKAHFTGHLAQRWQRV